MFIIPLGNNLPMPRKRDVKDFSYNKLARNYTRIFSGPARAVIYLLVCGTIMLVIGYFVVEWVF